MIIDILRWFLNFREKNTSPTSYYPTICNNKFFLDCAQKFLNSKKTSAVEKVQWMTTWRRCICRSLRYMDNDKIVLALLFHKNNNSLKEQGNDWLFHTLGTHHIHQFSIIVVILPVLIWRVTVHFHLIDCCFWKCFRTPCLCFIRIFINLPLYKLFPTTY